MLKVRPDNLVPITANGPKHSRLISVVGDILGLSWEAIKLSLIRSEQDMYDAEHHYSHTDDLDSFLGGFVDYFSIDRELIEKVEAAFTKSLEYDKANNEFTKEEMYALGLELASLQVDKDLTSYDSTDDTHGSPFD
ncbi:hypothetical protein H4219_000877 [Mycoemilia scoparia]|uniref:Uncharacterized protein n=1 Tax=Mycoemilia scoparia TaxID=417184 RepID=A0A9W8A4N2_9FUNG|nr:hypothetical protein H4219_000877 [Mycoemilia scoparia]